uniref:Hypothetical secreted peptide n=1 Tax=Triatoma matogrossensis TaxID=162370 RepID=E2J7B9_9HEMI
MFFFFFFFGGKIFWNIFLTLILEGKGNILKRKVGDPLGNKKPPFQN